MAVIEMFCGSMGNGKSALVNSRAFRFLNRGGVVGLNYPLVDDWAVKYATRILPVNASAQQILDKACSLYSRMFRFGSVESCYHFVSLVPGLSTGKQAKTREEHGLQVFDECGLYFNARDFSQKRNMAFIEFFLNLRKFKTQGIFMSHSDEDIDKQIRAKVEVITWCRNMAKRKILGFHLGLFYKKPKFKTQSIVNGKGAFKGQVEDKGSFTLDFDTCDLYDTFQLFKGDSMDEFELGPQGQDPQQYFTVPQIEDRRKYLRALRIKASPAVYFNYNDNSIFAGA